MSETRNIIVLGASYAGSGAAHYFLKHIRPALPSTQGIAYKVILVDPSAKWYLRHASPRCIASEDLVPEKEVLLDTASGFKQYGDAVQFIQAAATSWDPEKRTVTISKASTGEETLSYHALVLATGTKHQNPIYSLQGTSHTDVEDALHRLRKQISSAKKIVVAGGGPAGVETAAELGESLNGAAGWFSSWPSKINTEITLVTSSSQLLPVLRESLGKKAESYLNRVGVKVRYNTKVASAEETAAGKTKVLLHDGEEVVADLYIPALGLAPMTSYVPSHLLDKDGYIKTNEETLRVDEAGPRVYAVGDVGSYSPNDLFLGVLEGVPTMSSNLKRDLLASHSDLNAKATGQDKKWRGRAKETQLVPVGRSKGVGAVFGWRMPSIMVWAFKGRTYMLDGKGNVDKLKGGDWTKEKK